MILHKTVFQNIKKPKIVSCLWIVYDKVGFGPNEFLFLHHFLHAFPSLAVGNVDEVDAGRQIAIVHSELFAFSFGRYRQPKGITKEFLWTATVSLPQR